ncbi:MAG: CDP-alcohol phosphatidyltransferase family protein [Pseudomonadota bacterium]|jgi:CDP-diacylglycerol---glycerol-3-phosphate 3-phosphatidyltransferase
MPRAAETGGNCNLPNALSAVRLLLAPVLLWLAQTGRPEPFLWCLGVALVTDLLDGYLARRWGQTTELGVRLDSWGDLATYAAMALGLMWLWPAHFARLAWFVYLAIGFYLIPVLTSLLKFHELPRYHTWAAKLSAVLMAPAYYLLVLGDVAWPFQLVVLFHIWVAVEEVIITVILTRRQYDVPTLFHAREIMRRQRRALRERVERRRRARTPGGGSPDGGSQ